MSEEQREVKVLEAEGGSGSRFGRREMLKKSAIAGGAVVWAVPAVEMIGTRIAAAGSVPLSIGTCSVEVTGITNLYGSTVTVKYTTSSEPSVQQTETITISSSGGLSFGQSGNPLGFALDPPYTTLTADLASLADTPSLVSVSVTEGTVSDPGPFGSNCNPFTISASSAG